MTKVRMCAGLLLTASAAVAQVSVSHVYSAASLQAQGQVLLPQALQGGNGSAGVTLEKYPDHFTMLTVRTRNGSAEVHAHFADIFVVVDGEATLLTGGTVPNLKESANGESTGASVQGGLRKNLGKGDIVHIPANVPHQLLIEPGKSFTYFVVKVQQ